jgi:hypothetical protein
MIPLLARGAGSAAAKLGSIAGAVGLGAAGVDLARITGGGVTSEVTGAASRERVRGRLASALPLGGQTLLQVSRLNDRLKEAEARLAAMQPHMYTELLVGRSLAPGTRVYGLRQNREALEEVLLRMVSGQYGGPRNVRS